VGEAEEAVTQELERNFEKADFARMRVIGQFNLGFILARLRDELFIIDQHAADEKHNFERLQQVTRLNKQPLLHPRRLQLTPAEAVTLRCSPCAPAKFTASSRRREALCERQAAIWQPSSIAVSQQE
jgi:DNA mismatch repair ATPase MutL